MPYEKSAWVNGIEGLDEKKARRQRYFLFVLRYHMILARRCHHFPRKDGRDIPLSLFDEGNK